MHPTACRPAHPKRWRCWPAALSARARVPALPCLPACRAMNRPCAGLCPLPFFRAHPRSSSTIVARRRFARAVFSSNLNARELMMCVTGLASHTLQTRDPPTPQPSRPSAYPGGPACLPFLCCPSLRPAHLCIYTPSAAVLAPVAPALHTFLWSVASPRATTQLMSRFSRQQEFATNEARPRLRQRRCEPRPPPGATVFRDYIVSLLGLSHGSALHHPYLS